MQFSSAVDRNDQKGLLQDGKTIRLQDNERHLEERTHDISVTVNLSTSGYV